MASQNIKPVSKIDVYATLQITKDKLFFIVTHYKRTTKRKVIVYKKAIDGHFLDEKDVVLNKTHTRNTIYDCIAEYELEFKNTLIGIILILPTKTLDIRESEQIKLSEGHNQIIANSKIKDELMEAISNDMHKSTKTVVKYIPEYWEFDNEKSLDYAYDRRCYRIKLKGKNFSIDTDVLNSHKSVLTETGRQIICAEFDNFATAFRVIPQPSFLYNSVIMFDINNSFTSISFILHETCFKYIYSNNQLTINGITSEIAKTLNIKEKAASNYLYNLIDFEEGASNDLIYFRKSSKNSFPNFEISKKGLKLIYEKNLQLIISAIDRYLESETSHPEKIEVYITGEITKIAGIGSLIKENSKYAKQIKLYMPFVIGEKNTEDTVSLGAVEYIISYNESKKVTKYSTSTYVRNKVEEAQRNISKDGLVINGEELDADILAEIPTGFSLLPNADFEQIRYSLDSVKKNQFINNPQLQSNLVNDTMRSLNNIPHANINAHYPNNMINIQNQQLHDNLNHINAVNNFKDYRIQHPNNQSINNNLVMATRQAPQNNSLYQGNNIHMGVQNQMSIRNYNPIFSKNILPNQHTGVYNMVRENSQQQFNNPVQLNRTNNLYGQENNFINQHPGSYINQQNGYNINPESGSLNSGFINQINPMIKKY